MAQTAPLQRHHPHHHRRGPAHRRRTTRPRRGRHHPQVLHRLDPRSRTTGKHRPRPLPLPSNLPLEIPDHATQRPQPAYQLIADDLRKSIRNGSLRDDAPLPTTTELATTYQVAPSTAHRAITMLANQNLITVTPGHRARINRRAEP
ncbi:winged helix-turn-helix domain-containing protein [Actinokineospora xionganensis]|uniref:winged helix-turn-helix domain-containing protein n=1 Tax=Actinokineospora xionganensis TaxID=2684470 RepID=UPI0035E440EB